MQRDEILAEALHLSNDDRLALAFEILGSVVRPGQAENGDEAWDQLLSSDESASLLDDLAAQAMEHYRAGRTTEIDPDKL